MPAQHSGRARSGSWVAVGPCSSLQATGSVFVICRSFPSKAGHWKQGQGSIEPHNIHTCDGLRCDRPRLCFLHSVIGWRGNRQEGKSLGQRTEPPSGTLVSLHNILCGSGTHLHPSVEDLTEVWRRMRHSMRLSNHSNSVESGKATATQGVHLFLPAWLLSFVWYLP